MCPQSAWFSKVPNSTPVSPPCTTRSLVDCALQWCPTQRSHASRHTLCVHEAESKKIIPCFERWGLSDSRISADPCCQWCSKGQYCSEVSRCHEVPSTKFCLCTEPSSEMRIAISASPALQKRHSSRGWVACVAHKHCKLNARNGFWTSCGWRTSTKFSKSKKTKLSRLDKPAWTVQSSQPCGLGVKTFLRDQCGLHPNGPISSFS